jgi:glycosyltransferase involved in cell wall biosynthesis
MPSFSVIIPYYRSAETVRYTLESVHRARLGIDCEILLVDDGSDVPAEEELAGFEFGPDGIIRQENRGLLFARLKGLEEARGDYTLFLDADDLIGPSKLSDAEAAFTDPEVVVVYSDTAKTKLEGEFNELQIKEDPPAPDTTDLAEFFINVQPAPHSPIFRTAFLKELVSNPLFPPLPAYNPVAEIWFYFNAATRPGKAVHVPGAQTIYGAHGGERITGCWEKMAVASLLVEEAFQRTCPVNNETEDARRLFGEKVFRSWRALPYDFSKEYQSRKLRLWRSSPPSRLSEVGHGKFQTLAKVFGAELAGRFLRRIQGNSYDSVRTLSRDVEIPHEAGQ